MISNIILFIILMTTAAYAKSPMICAKDHCIDIEVARLRDQLTKGLMDRDVLPRNHGMLFVFTEDEYHSFWMKHMRFALDMLWLDNEGRVIDIAANVSPCVEEVCPSMRPKDKARYVLEINAGDAQRFHWGIGEKLNVEGL